MKNPNEIPYLPNKTITPSEEAKKVALDVANLLKLNQIAFIGSYARFAILNLFTNQPHSFTAYEIKNIALWEPHLNHQRLEHPRITQIGNYCYDIQGCAMDNDKRVKLFTFPDEVRARFILDRPYYVIDKNAPEKAAVFITLKKKEQMLKGILHPRGSIQQQLAYDPGFIFDLHKEMHLKGSVKVSSAFQKAAKNCTFSEVNLTLENCYEQLFAIHQEGLKEHGNNWLHGLKDFTIIRDVLDYKPNNALEKNTPSTPMTLPHSFRVPRFFLPHNASKDNFKKEIQFQQGNDFYFGLHGKKQDSNRAVALFKRAADQGFVPAYYYLGLCYLYGDGLKQNAELAFEYFKKTAETKIETAETAEARAALQAVLLARTELACLYLTGTGVSYQWEMGMYWMDQAAKEGEAYALRCFAKFYEDTPYAPAQDNVCSTTDAAIYYKKCSENAYTAWYQTLKENYPSFVLPTSR